MTSVNLKYQKEIPIRDGYDVVVCGGGPSGIPAALAAARAGLKVLLVESTGQLGGVGTSAGVSFLLGGRTYDNKHQCVRGIFLEICRELLERGAAIDPEKPEDDPHPSNVTWLRKIAAGFQFDPIQMVALLDEKMLAAGVDVLFFTQFVDVRLEGGQVREVVLFNKSGLFAVPAKAIVDATGDADVAARSGCKFVKGREDGLMTPATLMFVVDCVDQELLSEYIQEKKSPRFRELIQSLRQRGEWPFPFDIFISLQTPDRGTFMINTTRICDVDGTDGVSISSGMMRGRREVHQLFAVMKKHIPGFSKSRIINVSPVLGIRETRRIEGERLMTREDVISRREFSDSIGFSGYLWDLPDPKRPSFQPLHENKTPMPYLTPIPYGVLVPKGISNVICPGRAISIERDVMGPLRVMGPCYAMGEAAGNAALQVVEKGIAFKDVDVDRLRSTLSENGCIVDLRVLFESDHAEAR